MEKSNGVCTSDKDPLLDDEILNQKSLYGIDNFRFNKGGRQTSFTEYVAEIKNVYVEPSFFVIIRGWNTIIKESLIYDWYQISIKKYLFARITRSNMARLDHAILFDGKVGLNYFHFYNDVICKIFKIQQYFTSEQPLLISKELYDSKLFRYFLQFSFLNKWNWQVAGSADYMHIKKLYFLKYREYDRDGLGKVAGIARKASFQYDERFTKIFINRRERYGRYIQNFNSLQPVLNENGFLIVYLEDLSIPEQINLFANAKIIIAIHGAGLTNIIFTLENDPLILEIFPSDFVPTHYFWLANAFSLNYKAFMAGNMHNNSYFEIDVERFKRNLLLLLRAKASKNI